MLTRIVRKLLIVLVRLGHWRLGVYILIAVSATSGGVLGSLSLMPARSSCCAMSAAFRTPRRRGVLGFGVLAARAEQGSPPHAGPAAKATTYPPASLPQGE